MKYMPLLLSVLVLLAVAGCESSGNVGQKVLSDFGLAERPEGYVSGSDKVFEKDGAKVLVDMKSLLYLTGTELDYKDELMQSGFVFQNPNVKKACGCGASFTV